MLKIENREQLDTLISSSLKLIIDFYSPSCAPCKMMEPLLEKLENQHENYIFVKVDISSNEEIAKDFCVRSVPTLMMFDDGVLSATKVGLLSEDKLKAFIEG